jgi:hypothetical protein
MHRNLHSSFEISSFIIYKVPLGSRHLLAAAMVGAAAKPPASPQPPPGNKPRPGAPQREAGSPGRRSGRLPLALRIFVSLLIAWHFAGVFLAAMSVNGSSELVNGIAQSPPMQWYLDALYMNQGHSFFAPEVGPGQIIRYELFDQSGRLAEQGELPNRKEHWPRLRYHRHFMLADQAGGIPSDNAQYRDYWQRKYLEGYADHLLRTHDNAESVRVERVVHWPIPRDFALQGRKLTDPESYQPVFQVTRQRSALGPSERDQTGVIRPHPQQPYRQQQRVPNTAQRWIGVPR